MKTRAFIATLLFTLAAAAGAHEYKPLHGGVVAEAGDMAFELVAKANVIDLYMHAHGPVAGMKGATGKVTLLSGKEKAEAALVPAGDDRLQARGSFTVSPGTKVVATVNLAGQKPVSVRFSLP